MHLRRLAVSMTAIVGLAASAFFYESRAAQGSDHQDAPAVLARPGADITDIYVFPSPRNADYVDFVMDVHPLIPAGMSGNIALDPGVVYNLKASYGPSGGPAAAGFQLKANGSGPNQTVTLYGHYGALSWTQLGQPLGTFPFNHPSGTLLNNQITAFAGPRSDPFFFDLFQFFKILPDRDAALPRTNNKLGSATPTFNGFPKGSTSGAGAGNYPCSTAPSTNALTQLGGGFNVISVVLEVPRRTVIGSSRSPIIHLWATTSVPVKDSSGKTYLSQIELLSRPAVKELFEIFSYHAITNAREPYNDPTIAGSIYDFMLHVAGRSPAIAKTVEAVLYPNQIIADISQPGHAAYLGVETGGATGGKFGGRGLTDDVIDTSLGVVFGNTIPALGLAPDDHKENLCLAAEHVISGQGGQQTQSTFPYLVAPH